MDDSFFDFMLFWELMGENEEGFKCPLCGETIEKGRELEFTSKKEKIFLCPECGGRLIFDSIENEVRACPEEEAKPRRKTKREIEDERWEEYLRREKEKIAKDVERLSFPVGVLKTPEKFLFKNTAYFYLDLITTDFKAKDRDSAIKEIVGMFTGTGLVKNGRDFYKNLSYREVLGTTALGNGAAMPEAPVHIEEPMVVAVAISKQGVDFNSLDGKPVKIFFTCACNPATGCGSMVGVRLKMLARIACFLDKSEVRAALLNAGSDEEVFAYLKENLEKSWWFHK